jgi:hypothetical protein
MEPIHFLNVLLARVSIKDIEMGDLFFLLDTKSSSFSGIKADLDSIPRIIGQVTYQLDQLRGDLPEWKIADLHERFLRPLVEIFLFLSSNGNLEVLYKIGVLDPSLKRWKWYYGEDTLDS